jgi:glycosyltransferase involved in cell wall biosynthesis
MHIADAYRTTPDKVVVIPHPKDLRSWFEFGEDACAFIDEFPAVMQADVVQIYPASADRMEAKRVLEVMQIFAEIKKLGFSIGLVIANQHATTRSRKEDITRYRKLARRHGLTNEDLYFTSDWREGAYDSGIPKRMLRELLQCSNLFVFPTREESFGLVLPEAVLAGGVLPVLNKSLDMLMEVSGLNALYVDFGSWCQSMEMPEGWAEELASLIIGRIQRCEATKMKTFVRQRYNWDALYRRYYKPTFAESAIW